MDFDLKCTRINKGKVWVVFVLLIFHAQLYAQFPTFGTPELNGINGSRIRGLDKRDQVGFDISFAGDVNGDGIDDFIAGAPTLDPGGRVDAGGAYVFFGTTGGFGTEFDVSTLNGNNGFVIHGKNAEDLAGFSVSTAGDINDDGFDDVLLSAHRFDDNTPPDLEDRGEAYVIFGTNTGFPPIVRLSNLNGSNGFTIEASSTDELFGIDVSYVGDVNDDGLDDIIIGSSDARAFPDPAERAYVIFGSSTAFGSPVSSGPATINVADLDGSNGFQILANETNPISFGYVVDAAGDVNGDGVDDIAIGAPRRNNDRGNAYVIYGKPSGDSFSATLETSLLNGTNGFYVTSSSVTLLGLSITTIGDINQDGLDDLWIGAPRTNSSRGVGYVIYGSVGGPPTTGTPALFDLSSLNGTNGFIIRGSNAAFFTGSDATTVGDFDGDGRNDLLVGSPGSEFDFNSQSGLIHVIFGTDAGFPSRLDLPDDVNGFNGFQFFNFRGLPGPCDGDPDCTQDDWMGARVSAADINGDGLDDLLLGSHSPFYNPILFDPNRIQLDGFYVLYGNHPPKINSVTPADDTELWYVSELELQISEEVFPNSGNIEVRLVTDNSLVTSVDVTSPSVTFNNDRVTIDLPELLPGGDYYVRIPPNAINDDWGASVSINDNTTWNFKVLAPFIITWRSATSRTFIIPTEGDGYDYDVTFTNLTNPGVNERSGTGRTRDYQVIDMSVGDTYQVTIRRDFPRIYFNGGSERNKIRTIEQWGDIQWTSMENAFDGCSNLAYNATDAPDLSGVTDLSSMFRRASNFNGDLSDWNTSNIQDMSAMFNSATSFNGDISTWITGNVTSMRGMFDGATSFNSDISNWNVGEVQDMGFMFSNASMFNIDIGAWNVGKVEDFEGTLINATDFNQDLGGWDMTSATNLSRMLNDCALDINNYNQLLRGWSTQSVQSGRILGAANLQYSCDSENERQSLVDDDGWTIQGDVSSSPVPDLANLADVTAQCEVTNLVEPSASSGLGDVTITNDATLPITLQGTTVVTWTYTDALNCTNTQIQHVVIADNTDPIALAQDITVWLDASGSATITSAEIDNGSTDNCSISSLSLDVTDFSCSDVGANPVILTATDGRGNVNTTTATVTVEDAIDPMVVAQDITVQLDEDGSVTITSVEIDNGSTDNCSIPSLSLDVTDFSCADIGTNTVTLTAMDGSGNRSQLSADVTVEDNLAPEVVTQDIIIQLDDAGNASIASADVDNGSLDNCGISLLSLDMTDFNCVHVGVLNTVTLTALDGSGNMSQLEAEIMVEDNLAPEVFTQDVVVSLDASGNALITAIQIDNGSFDNCEISNLALDQTAFSCADIGINIVTLTAIDNSGNMNKATANVTVIDNAIPVINTQNMTIGLGQDGNASVTVADIDNGSFDNCGISRFTIDETDFSCADLGINTINLLATDANGNINSATATITIEDYIDPVTIAQDINVELDASGNAILLPDQLDGGSMDNCGVERFEVSQEVFGCMELGPNTITLSAFDVSGNSTNAASIVTVLDNIAPVFDLCPGDIVTSNPIVQYDLPIATDNCSIASLDLVEGFESGGTFPLGNTQVIYESKDQSGNIAICSFSVTIEEESELLDIPSAFTPNNDGVNDTWNILYTSNYPNLRLRIFDLSGNEVFSSIGYNREWDGNYRGNILPTATYYYIINLNDNLNRTLKGRVTLIK